MRIVSVSRHAQDRYRLRYHDADAGAVLLAAQRALPIDGPSAFALAGRRPVTAEDDDAQHRLHLDGTGLFVLREVREAPGEWYVHTFLRFPAPAQRALARRWFLDGLRPLEDAFALGFRTAGGDDTSLAVALAAARQALGAMAAAVPAVQDPNVGEATQDDAPEPVTPTPPVPRGAPLRLSDAGHEQLVTALRHHPGLDPDVEGWSPAPADVAARVRGWVHAGTSEEVRELRVAPDGSWIAVVTGPDDRLVVDRLISVPRAHRAWVGLRVGTAPGGASAQAGEPSAPAVASREVVAAALVGADVSRPVVKVLVSAVKDAAALGRAAPTVQTLAWSEPLDVADAVDVVLAQGWAAALDGVHQVRRLHDLDVLVRVDGGGGVATRLGMVIPALPR